MTLIADLPSISVGKRRFCSTKIQALEIIHKYLLLVGIQFGTRPRIGGFMKIWIAIVAGLVCVANANAHEIALVQYNADAHFADYQYNLNQLTHFAEEAIAHGAKIIVFPEGSIYGYSAENALWCRIPDQVDPRCKDVKLAAETIPGGKTSNYWGRFAKKNHVYILFDLPEKSKGSYYNTTAVFGPIGFVARYRKQVPIFTDAYYASWGDFGPVTFQTPFGRFGLLICMDGNYAALYQVYKNLGVTQLIIPMDWGQDPNGSDGARPARIFFQTMATTTQMNLFVSDVSTWDGTGVYLKDGKERVRDGLPPIAIGIEGISYYRLTP
jgi:predicted amidohydrolase